MPKACPYVTIISAKGIYRAALLNKIQNFPGFETSRSCVVVNAFLDVDGGLCLRGSDRALPIVPPANPQPGFCGRSVTAKLILIYEIKNEIYSFFRAISFRRHGSEPAHTGPCAFGNLRQDMPIRLNIY